MKLEIVNMLTLCDTQLKRAAQMLTAELPLGWATLADAMEEITGLLSLDDGSVFLAAVENNKVAGWCGILPEYNGNVYELHPLVVRKDMQGRGIGSMLIEAVTAAAKEKGGLTLMLGADDECPGGETSFANVDLYDDLPRRLREFEPGTHQSAFYIKHGFKVVGVMPDANGKGKPDIMLAKSIYSDFS